MDPAFPLTLAKGLFPSLFLCFLPLGSSLWWQSIFFKLACFLPGLPHSLPWPWGSSGLPMAIRLPLCAGDPIGQECCQKKKSSQLELKPHNTRFMVTTMAVLSVNCLGYLDIWILDWCLFTRLSLEMGKRSCTVEGLYFSLLCMFDTA